MSQKKVILRELLKGKKISQLSALRQFDCMRLADVVWNLRKEGHDVKREWRKQGGRRIAVYKLAAPEKS